MFGLSLSAFLPRIIGIAVSFLVGQLANRTGFIVDPTVLTGAMLAVYAGTHRAASVVINPADAASHTSVEDTKVTNTQINNGSQNAGGPPPSSSPAQTAAAIKLSK